MTELTVDQFNTLSKYIYDLCGLVIPQEKAYLITQRLEPILPKLGYRTISEICTHVSTGIPRHISEMVIAAITTNETFFFRDVHPFVTFSSNVLPHLVTLVKERKSRPSPRSGPKVRIWSAAASTGQEAYSLAILIAEKVGLYGGNGLVPDDFEIVATDISSEVMAKAIKGEYNDFEMSRGLSAQRKSRFFQQQANGNWKIDQNIQRIVTFRCCNLLESLSWLGSFDCIFCRNLLIYFDSPTKARICRQFAQMLNVDGPLFLGASENLLFLQEKDTLFKTLRCGETIYYSKIS